MEGEGVDVAGRGPQPHDIAGDIPDERLLLAERFGHAEPTLDRHTPHRGVPMREASLNAAIAARSAGYDKSSFARFADEIGPLLEADDIARTVEFVLEQPPHVHPNDIMVRPTRQPYP
jgi:hypothetical protein